VFKLRIRAQAIDKIFVSIEFTTLSWFNPLVARCEWSDSSGLPLEGVQHGVI